MKKKMQNVGTKSAFMPIFIELFFLFTSLSFLFYYFYRTFFFFFFLTSLSCYQFFLYYLIISLRASYSEIRIIQPY